MNRTFLSACGLLAFALACVGCTCEESCKPPTSPPTDSATAASTAGDVPFRCCVDGEAEEAPVLAAAEDASWGTLKGQAIFVGDPPAKGPVKVDKDVAHCLSKGPIPNEEWVVNSKNKGVRWTFVWLAAEDDPVNKGKLPIHPDLKASKTPTVEMDQPCCRFEPHVLAMRDDQQLIFKNSAPIPHNVNYAGDPLKNPGDNKLLPAGGQLVISLKAQPRPVSVACNIHSWMKAYVRVYDHPYFAVTDENGNFEIKNAPAGKWRLIAWHETGGWLLGKRLTKENFIPVEIKPNATTEVKVDVKPTE
jgi:hypothetical protein